jgi:hypothetical protein
MPNAQDIALTSEQFPMLAEAIEALGGGCAGASYR